MKAARRLTPRKKPLQSRAQTTVDTLLQAATYILIEQGWGQFTTNHIAARAGVNIASLYQYFPSKEAIVAELQRRHSLKIRELFPRLLPELVSKRDLRSLLRSMVEAAVREHRVDPALHGVLAEELPRSARRLLSPKNDPMKQRWEELMRPFLRNVPDAEVASFVARIVTHAAIHEAAFERPGLLEGSLLVDEIVTLLERYLDRPATRRSPRRTAIKRNTSR